MKRKSNVAIPGAILIGVGCGLAAAGLVLVIPACVDWSASVLETVIQRGREGVGSAAATLGEFAGRTHSRFDEAAKTAKASTAKAAGAVEMAARHVKEYTS